MTERFLAVLQNLISALSYIWTNMTVMRCCWNTFYIIIERKCHFILFGFLSVSSWSSTWIFENGVFRRKGTNKRVYCVIFYLRYLRVSLKFESIELERVVVLATGCQMVTIINSHPPFKCIFSHSAVLFWVYVSVRFISWYFIVSMLCCGFCFCCCCFSFICEFYTHVLIS